MAANKSDAAAIQTFGEANYTAMPKSVLAMIAYSFAQLLSEDSADRDVVLAKIENEWQVLNLTGIVPQKMKRLETREQEAARIESYATTRNPGVSGDLNRARIAELRAPV